MDLLYFLKVLYRKKWFILALSFFAVVAAFVFLLNKKPLYESVAQYSTGFTTEKVRAVDGTTGIDLYTADVKFNNVIETFKSPQVISMISYKLLLHDIDNPTMAYRKLGEKAMETPIFKKMNRKTARDILATKITKTELLSSNDETERILIEYLKLYGYDYATLNAFMSISRVERTDYLNVAFRSENPDLSAVVVNTMGEEFLNYFKHLSSRRSQENASNIQGMVANQQKRVDSLVTKLLNEKVSQGTIDPVSRTASAMETVKELETKLQEEKSKFNYSSNRLKNLKARLSTLQASLSNSGGTDLVTLINRKNKLVNDLASKGGNDPDMQKQIDDLSAEIKSKSGNSTNAEKTKNDIDQLNKDIADEQAQYDASETTISDYTSAIQRYTAMTNQNPGSTIKIDAIKSQLELENTQLKNVREKFSQAEGLVKDDPSANFIQTMIGQPAIEPESKRTLITMALSGISVLFLSSVFFLFLEIFDSTVKIPTIFSKQSRMKIASTLNIIKLRRTSAPDVVLQDHDPRKQFKQTVFQNNIRKLRFEVLNSGKHIFLITSTQKGSGKTTSLEALAASLLLSKKRVLMIDLNFSSNTLTQKYNTDVFIQDIAEKWKGSLPASIRSICGTTPYDDLYIIGCKEGNYTPAEVLYNLDMNVFLHALRKEFDYILIEGAALNSYSDSKELAQYAEAVFTVFAADASISPADTESFDFITKLKEKNHGVILNNVLTENIKS